MGAHDGSLGLKCLSQRETSPAPRVWVPQGLGWCIKIIKSAVECGSDEL